MKAPPPEVEELRDECAALRAALTEAEATLSAIRNGEVDALVVNGPNGDQIFTLSGAAEPYRKLVEEMNEGAATLADDGTVLYCNRHFSDLLAVPQEQVIGSFFETYATPADVATLRRLLRQASTGRSSGEITLATGAGRSVLVNLALNPLPSTTPAKVCLLITDLTERQKKELALLNLMEDLADSNTRLEAANRDLSLQVEERKRAEEALTRSLSRIRGFVDANIVGVLVATVDGTIKEANDYYLRMIGYTREEFEAGAVNWRTLTPPEWRAVDENALRELTETGRCTPYEKEYLRHDGTRVPVLLVDAMLPGAQADIAAFALDLTERKQTQRELEQLNLTLERRVLERTEELRQSEERFRTIAANTPDHVLVQDLDLRYTLVVNPQLGLTEADMLGRTDDEFLAKDDAARLNAIKREVLKNGKPYPLEMALLARSGEREHFEGSYVPKLSPDGKIDGLIGYFRNVTARQRAEAALRESQQRTELALQVARAFAFEWNVENDEVVRSSHCADILGLGGDATHDTARAFFQQVHPEDRAHFVRTVTGLSRTNPNYAVEYRVVRPDGQTVVLQESATGTFDADGKLTRLVGMTADITARVRAEQSVIRLNQELNRRMLELQTIFDTAPAGLAIADEPQVQHVRGNPALEQMLGVESGAEFSIASQRARFRVVKDGSDMPLDDMPLQRAGRGEPVVGQILEVIRPDGAHRFLYSNATPLRDETGQPSGVVGVFLDITESKRAEEALRESELRFRNIYDTAPVSIWREDWTDVIALIRRARAAGVTNFREYFQTHPDVVAQALADVRILDVNQWTVTMFEARDKSQLLASLSTVFATPDTAPGFIEELVALASDQGVFRTEMTFNTVTGGRIHCFMAIAFPLIDSGTGSVLVSVIDITQRKRAEMELSKLAAELKIVNHELESFAYSISHDLRAPLRSIDGFSRIVLRDCTTLDEKHRENLLRVRQASQRMGELIDDLLELSRTTRASLRRVKVDLSAMVGFVTHDLQQADPARRVTLVIAPGVSATADPVLLRSALENLLGNAWKFTARREDARIEFGVGEKGGERVFFVRDNGVGFDMAYAGKLFGAFQRLHSPRDFPGTGIGLAAVQRIVHRHGGRIWVEAAVNAGATFYFTLGPASSPP